MGSQPDGDPESEPLGGRPVTFVCPGLTAKDIAHLK